MAARKHSLRLVTSEATEAPKSIEEELGDIDTELLHTISLLEVLQRSVQGDDEDAELWAALGIAVRRFHSAHGRLDHAGIRLAHEGAPATLRKVRS